jgi:hypothetical protein
MPRAIVVARGVIPYSISVARGVIPRAVACFFGRVMSGYALRANPTYDPLSTNPDSRSRALANP